MTTPTLPARLLAEEIAHLRELCDTSDGCQYGTISTQTVRNFCTKFEEAAAALSVRVPEGDMARALEWVRTHAMFSSDPAVWAHCAAIEEAIAAYDPERAGAFSGKLSGREQPGDGCCAMTPTTREQRDGDRCDGSRPLAIDRDLLGRLVREEWVRWAREQPNPKPSWLVPYDELPEADKEADRRIGECAARWAIVHDAAQASLQPQQEAPGAVACDAAAIERALVVRAFQEDGAKWPDAYSAEEQEECRKITRLQFAAANETDGPCAYCRACQAAGMQNCQHFNECEGATCITCHRPLNTTPQPMTP